MDQHNLDYGGHSEDLAVKDRTRTISMFQRITNGDRLAWEALDRRFRPFVMDFLLNRELQLADAEDLCQITLKDLREAIPRYMSSCRTAKPRTFLLRIVVNNMIDFQRQLRQRREEQFPEHSSSPAIQKLADLSRSNMERVIEEEYGNWLWDRTVEDLRKLTDIQEKTLRAYELRFRCENPVVEIAAELDMSAKNVYASIRNV